MYQQGADVIAVEPNDALRGIGKNVTPECVIWLDDDLSALKNTINLGMRFNVILLSAVWMHLPSGQRERAFRKLTNLLAPNGKLVITLRHGSFSDGRQSYPVSVDELEIFSNAHGLKVLRVSESKDNLNRGDVQWQTVVMTLPDDGAGNLNTVRRIVVNDSKSATYKLALLRTLLRIADAHPGAVIERREGKVAVSAGLVALYWVRQFKRLLDIEIDGSGLQQNANTSKGLGFVKSDGWGLLKDLCADDFSIGALFLDDDVRAIQKLFSYTLQTIKAGPS
ncbi:hypothetical protein SKA34_08268 [Photobacterium sp. SKA34]|nr:hypothetical protein SKA34_08268 [Photobacterium sp. SKA34]